MHTFAKDVENDIFDKYDIELSMKSIRRQLNELNLKSQFV